MNFLFFFNSILIGLGLSMDAFSVSLANGLAEPKMPLKKHVFIAGTFGVFQGAMPLIGWLCVHTIIEQFSFFQAFIPYIALALLLFLGVKRMFWNGVEHSIVALGSWILDRGATLCFPEKCDEYVKDDK